MSLPHTDVSHECIPIETVEKNFAKTALILKIHTVFAVRIEFCLSVFHKVLVWTFCTNLLCKTITVNLEIPVFVSFPIKCMLFMALFMIIIFPPVNY